MTETIHGAETFPAYMLDEGDVANLPGVARPKRIYLVEDAGTRHQHRDGRTYHVALIRFHVNGNDQTAGVVTVDFDHLISARKA